MPGHGAPAQSKRRRGCLFVLLGVGALFVIVVVAVAANSGGSTTSNPGAAPSAAPASSEPNAAAQQSSGHYGDPLSAGDLTLTVSAPKKVTEQYLGAQTCSTVSYQNTGSAQEQFNLFDWKFRSSAGVESNATGSYSPDNSLQSGELAPGGKTSGQVCADSSIKTASAVVYSPGFGILHELVWQ